MDITAPLSGYRVLDFTQFESGTACTETLAWLGAEVWKVERPKWGETGRYSYDAFGKDTYGFLILNMNKRSVTCDLKTAEGRQLMMRAAGRADVVVENFGPGVMERLGLDYDSFKAENPSIIYASIKGFGPDSPYRDYPAFSPIAQSTGGVAASTGLPDGGPLQPGVNLADSDAGYMCALSVIAALLQRERTGKGQRCDIAMQDVMIGLGRSNWEAYYLRGGFGPFRVGNGMPMEPVAPAEMYPCKPFGPNDYIHIYCSRHVGSRQFEYLCRAIGHEELLDDPRYATPQSRYQNRETLDPVIAEWTSRHEKQEAMDILCRAGVPAGAVLDFRDLSRDSSLRESGTLVEVEHPELGNVLVPGFVPKMSENQVAYRCSPALGADNDAFYRELLGLTPEEEGALREKGVI